MDPASLLDGLTARCMELGVRFLYDRRVTGIRARGPVVKSIIADGEEITADIFVLAAGVHTGPLTRLAGFPLPIQPGKGYGFDETSGALTLRHPVYLGEAKVAVTPLSDRLRFAGTMEFGSFDAAIDPHRLGGIVHPAREFLPAFSPMCNSGCMNEHHAIIAPWSSRHFPCAPGPAGVTNWSPITTLRASS